MDKILDLGDIFGIKTENFSPVLLLPIFTIVGAVAVFFVFGLKRTETPRFKRLVEDSSAVKRKKRAAESSSALTSTNNSLQSSHKKVLHQRTVAKKESSPAKKTGTPEVIIEKKGKLNSAERSNKTKVLENKKISKPMEIVSDKEGGEWHTVMTKKQKKQVDPLIQAVAKVAAVHSGKNKISTQTPSVKKTEKINPHSPKVLTNEKPTTAQDDNSEVLNSFAEFDHASKAEPLEVVVMSEEKMDSVAFDELGEPSWTDLKPPKKIKKRALRE